MTYTPNGDDRSHNDPRWRLWLATGATRVVVVCVQNFDYVDYTNGMFLPGHGDDEYVADQAAELVNAALAAVC